MSLSTATVLDATQIMNRHKIGALVVSVEGDGCERVVGMFTERDVLTRVVAAQRDPQTTLVEEVMSVRTSPTSTPEMEVDESRFACIMKDRRVRHIPVCESHGHLTGLISIGDINAFHADGQAAAIHYLNEYIHGRV